MKTKFKIIFPATLLVCITATATNYDEAKVGNYVLPDPLLCADGSRVTNSETWLSQRRPEILGLYRENIFGRDRKSTRLNSSHRL